MRLSDSPALLMIAGAVHVTAQSIDKLVGTWTTKSNSTITGPGFYDPTQDRFIEPRHPGISYSFTADGHYETAYYRAISNPTSPECVSAMLQFQHGSFELLPNGSLSLTPIAVDGRQLDSPPCNGDKAVYLRYNQSELMEKFAQYTDPYHGVPRLDLFQFNGAPLPPMYLVYKPPSMVPTTTLHPPRATDTSKVHRLARRTLGGLNLLPQPVAREERASWLDADMLWWAGLGMTGVGSVLYWCF